MISRPPGRRFVTVRGVVLVGDLYRDALPREDDYDSDEWRRSWTAHDEPRARRRCLGVRQDAHPLDRVGSSLTRPRLHRFRLAPDWIARSAGVFVGLFHE